ncbi:MAG: hypothetical protein UV78_C0012G0005 [Parcubacteria group bacterium GW2011_GWA2_43_17]|nr:MAG: hypothetical protein UV78_C0012G0005 [Parcubacteria group bacterium GW2011_GWA2_43_17]KKT91596.1 MAG: hypothetical protein UW91_C0030G0006 [Parcubacteria group bacterium GW2011_GWF2_45_11]
MRQLNKNEKMLAAAVAVSLLVMVLKLLVIEPVSTKFKNTGDEINAFTLAIKKYSALEAQKDFILGEYKKIEPYLNFKGNPEDKMAAVLSRIELEASKAGLTIVDMKPDSAQSGPNAELSISRVQLNAEADISRIMSFIYSLENADLLIRIEKFNLALKDENIGTMKLEASIIGISI